MRRVVVTGLGTVNPLGLGIDQSWTRLICAHSGINSILSLPHTLGRSKEARKCFPVGSVASDFKVAIHDALRYPRWIQLAVVAAAEAIESAQLLNSAKKDRIAIAIGTGLGSIEEIQNSTHVLLHGGFRKISPRLISAILPNTASALVSQFYKFQGPITSPSNSCITGASAIIDGMMLIKNHDADVVVAGGSESPLSPLVLAAFSQTRALSSFDSTECEEKYMLSSMPFDKQRRGFVLGEGAGVLILEEMEHALSRNATIFAEIKGHGLCCDGFHLTAMDPTGFGAKRSMSKSIENAGINTNDVGYINAHATSTPMGNVPCYPVGDAIEAKAIGNVFTSPATPLLVSSTKGSTGHLLGASGAVEAIFTILALRDNIIPPTLNLAEPDDECLKGEHIQYVAKYAKRPDNRLKYALSNSFGFGGVNATLVFGKV